MSELIESIIRRPNGTRVTLGNTNYHFKPDAAERHVAEVSEPAHVDRFLAIPEGYRIAERLAATDGIAAFAQQNQPNPEPPPQKPAATNTITPNADPDADSGDKTVEQDSTPPPAAPPAADKEPETTPPPPADEKKADPEPPKGEIGAALDKTKATEQYIAKFGKKPHHAWSVDIILAKIAEG